MPVFCPLSPRSPDNVTFSRLRQPVTCHISACCVGCRGRITDHPQGAGETGDIRLGFDSRGWLAGAAGIPWLEDRFRRWPVAVPGVGRDPGIARYCRRSSRRYANRPHSVVGLLRQPVFGRSAGYDDVNDADRPALDPLMRQVVGGRGVDAEAASAGRMGRFETGVSEAADNRGAPADVSGQWIDRGIDRAHAAMAPEWITPDMDGSVGPRHGAQEGTAWNVHFGCMCHHPFVRP